MKVEEIKSVDQLDEKFKDTSLNDMDLSDSDEEDDDDIDFMIYRINTYEDPDQVLR